MTGFITLDRRLLNWRWYKNSNTKDLFIHLLLIANFKDSEYENIVIKRGQAVAGRKGLAEALGMSEQNIRTALNHLKQTGEITVKSNQRFSVITICKYDDYQGIFQLMNNQQLTDNQPTTNQRLTNDQPTTNQQLTNDQPHHNNDNKETREQGNKDNKGIGYIEPSPVIELFKRTCVSFPKPVLYDELAKLINSCKDVDFRLLFEKAEKSDFLSGRSGKWKCDIAWVLKNAGKILSGAYDNRESPKERKKRSYDMDEILKIR